MTLKEVVTQYDYDELMSIYITSQASDERKAKAIRDLKIAFPEFDRSAHTVKDEILQDIKDGEADISDLGGIN